MFGTKSRNLPPSFPNPQLQDTYTLYIFIHPVYQLCIPVNCRVTQEHPLIWLIVFKMNGLLRYPVEVDNTSLYES